jgi:uncharacterized protein (DUF433 family)
MVAEAREDEVEVKAFGQHLVADPRICHGKWTVRGTRIMVSVILEQVARGLDWDTIIEEWGGRVSREVIREAVLLARDALIATTGEDRTAEVLGLLASK